MTYENYQPKSVCSICGRRSRYLQEYDGKNLCSFCLTYARQVNKAIKAQTKAPSKYRCLKCGASITLGQAKAYVDRCSKCYFETETVEKAKIGHKLMKCGLCGKFVEVEEFYWHKTCPPCLKIMKERYQMLKLRNLLKVEKNGTNTPD